MNIENFNIEDRVQTAIKNFESGCNCSQSVFMTYADLIGMDRETAGCVSGIR
ncbi:MAG: hypothetical protein LUE98_15175 [Tannerellaceae bacterium]|nr:hypothetical protein [Tannerellaceae bacterium]MCD8178679.1 hypothetical protein [Tannerellaceae bacterium]